METFYPFYDYKIVDGKVTLMSSWADFMADFTEWLEKVSENTPGESCTGRSFQLDLVDDKFTYTLFGAGTHMSFTIFNETDEGDPMFEFSFTEGSDLTTYEVFTLEEAELHMIEYFETVWRY